MDNIMVDLETLGKRAGCAVIAIGAAKFDPDTSVVDVDNTFYRAITLDSAMRYGLTVDPSTVRWWMQQSELSRAVFDDPEAVSIQAALVEFAEWVDAEGNYANVKMWGSGASFDIPVLSAAYEAVDIIQPWEFWNDRCYRTKKAEARLIPFVREGVAHNALDDAVSQAKHLCAIYADARARKGL